MHIYLIHSTVHVDWSDKYYAHRYRKNLNTMNNNLYLIWGYELVCTLICICYRTIIIYFSMNRYLNYIYFDMHELLNHYNILFHTQIFELYIMHNNLSYIRIWTTMYFFLHRYLNYHGGWIKQIAHILKLYMWQLSSQVKNPMVTKGSLML